MQLTALTSILTAAGPMLRPVVALNVWTLIMEVWMYATRLPAVERSKMKVGPMMTRESINAHIPAQTRWVSDNFNNLFEQPTQFYAMTLTLAFIHTANALDGAATNYAGLDVTLAWTYVGLRFLHSLTQSTVNHIPTRFALFGSSSVLLAVLTLRAGSILFL